MHIQKSYKDTKPSFYVIPTPIGNLEDITIRSLNILKELDILYCEDTRITKKLLNHFNISVKLITYNEHTDQKINEDILHKLNEGDKVGIVSDAGMPLISDPGFKLIRFLKENNINIVILPGPCAFLQPQVYFCHDNNPFIFRGFLSKQKSSYESEIKLIAKENFNTLVYETPHRILRTLEHIKYENLGNEILISREISKIYETYIQGNIDQVLEFVQNNPLKGEIVLIVGSPKISEEKINYLKEVENLIISGISLKTATKEISTRYNISKNKLYNEYLNNKNNTD